MTTESRTKEPLKGPSPEVHGQVGNPRTEALISPATLAAISAHCIPGPQVQARTAAHPIWIITGVRVAYRVHRSNREWLRISSYAARVL